jgi:O-antigen/teichoic acid export membrane protein
VTATVAFFALLLLNPVGMFMNRRLHSWELGGQIIRYFTYFWLYLLIVGAVSLLTLVALTEFKIWSPNMDVYWLEILVFGSLIFGTLNQVVIPGLNLLGYRGWFTVLTIATSAVSLIVAVVLVQTFSRNAEYWLTGILLGQLIIGIAGKKIFFNKIKISSKKYINNKSLSINKILYLFTFAWPVAIAVSLGWVQSQGYRYLMEEQLGLVSLGLFVAGYGISAGLVAGFESIFSTCFQPRFYERISHGCVSDQSRAWHEYAQAILPSLLLVMLLIIITAPELTQLLLGPEYRESAQFIVWGSLAESARIATAVFGMVAHARMNTRLLLWPNLVGAATSVPLIWFLMLFYGASGVGLGLMFSASICFLLTVRIISSHLVLIFIWRDFIKSLVMGGSLFTVMLVLREMWSGNDNYFLLLMRLFIVGIFFLLFQYLILRPVLQRWNFFLSPPSN